MFSKIVMTGLLLLGVLFFSFGQNQSAEYQTAITNAISLGKSKPAFLNALNDLNKEFRDYLSDNCSAEIDLYRNYGVHYYNNYKDSIALVYWLQCQEKIEQCDIISDSIHLQVQLNLEGVYEVLRKTQEREVVISKIQQIVERNPTVSTYFLAKTQTRIADFYLDRRDVDRSLIWLREALANYNKLPATKKQLLALRLYADNIDFNGDADQAIEQYKLLLSKTREIYGQENTSKHMFYSYSGLSRNNEAIGNLTEAKIYADSILLVGSAIKEAKWLLEGHNRTASIFEKQNKYLAATKQLDKSIALVKSATDQFEKKLLAPLYIRQFKNYNNLGDKVASANSLQFALTEVIDKGKFDKHYFFKTEGIVIRNNQQFLLGAKSVLEFNQDNKKIAEKYIDFALQVDSSFFRILDDYRGNAAKSEFSKIHHDFCEVVLNYLFRHNLQNRYADLTAYFISVSKSIILYDNISVSENLPTDLKNRYENIKSKELELQSGIGKADMQKDQEKVDSLSAIYLKLFSELEGIHQEMDKKAYRTDIMALKNNYVRKGQDNLSQEELIIDIFYSDSAIYSYFLDKETIRFKISPTPVILRKDFSKLFSENNGSGEQFDQLIEELSMSFFGSNSTIDFNYQHVAIVPDGKLVYLPFELLNVNGKALIEQSAVRYLFSYGLEQIERKKSDSKYDYIGYGLSYNSELLANIEKSDEISKLFGKKIRLAKLTNALEEIKNSSKILGGRTFLEESCSVPNFEQYAPQSKILHIASHALLNHENSHLSSIIFTAGNDATLLNGLDIRKLDLAADIAILSSCDSGQGELYNGNGIRSLGQAFATAGCPAVLVNLWEASDKSTSFIVSRFCKNLAEGDHKSLALRKAKLAYQEQASPRLKHPKYWANMVLIGDDDPIELNKQHSNQWPFYGLGIFALIGISYLISRTRKSSN